jgi:hypothetical protein
VLEQASLRAKILHERGALLHLEITPEPRLTVSKGRGELAGDGDSLIKTLEDAARSALEMRKQLATVALRATELSRQRIELRAEAPAAFRDVPQARRDEVIFELDNAEGVLADASDAANRYASVASRFVVELAQSIETGSDGASRPTHAALPPHRPVAAPGPPIVIRHAQTPEGEPHAAPIAPAAAKPTPPKVKGKATDDFEP